MKNSGFTLVELMIVIAIVAILVALALPNYNESVRKARRSDAQQELMEFGGLAERIFTQSNSYSDGDTLKNAVKGADDLSAYYGFSVVVADTSFSVTATPKDSQATDRWKTMSLDHRGDHITVDDALAGCW